MMPLGGRNLFERHSPSGSVTSPIRTKGGYIDTDALDEQVAALEEDVLWVRDYNTKRRRRKKELI